MFSRGPRFQPEKRNDVPGPCAYNTVDLDANTHKKGAFLEKTDRFSKEIAVDGPGPNAYLGNLEPRPISKPAISSAVIHQQLDALKSRLEKEHAREIQRLDQKLSRLEAKNSELAKERAAFQTSSSQAERELRLAAQRESTLRVSLEKTEEAVTRLQERAGNYATLQKKLDNLHEIHIESKRQYKEQVEKLQAEFDRQHEEHSNLQAELRSLRASFESERKLHTESSVAQQKARGDLEQSLRVERKKLEDALSKLDTAASSAENAAQQNIHLQEEVFAAREERDAAQTTLEALNEEIDAQRLAMRQAAEKYSDLTSRSVSMDIYRALRFSHAQKEVEVVRLERKHADRSGQVTELAQMIRNAEEINALLRAELDMRNEEIQQLRLSCRELSEQDCRTTDLREIQSMQASVQEGLDEYNRHQFDAQVSYARNEKLISQHCLAVLKEVLSTLQGLFGSTELVERYVDATVTCILPRLASLEAHADILETSNASKDDQLSAQAERLEELRLRDEDHERRTREAEECLAQQIAEGDRARAATALQMKTLNDMLALAKITEKNLLNDVASLEASLNDGVKFQEAHDALLKQVDILVSRNVLAEEEAEHLSKFNAQILGHTNVNQRIYYVDRLRKEMSEIKQTLITAEWERNAVKEENARLRHELDLYKAVKPTNAPPSHVVIKDASAPPPPKMTRIDRVPLASRDMNADWQLESFKSIQKSKGKQADHMDSMSITELSSRI
ncbi:uncharacterized protein EI90DRAFT_2179828 [Cantharellus anzutake]|uniref:uncharacterized protein n=1 Tax=Cantharellus anzutake TaxID=1750568 RepID=UPI001905BDC8|nr:uncharacterized protein EI90DRAFT_2179828 [Cantharellus anzutake]KAF8325219.1 hypothetical protein EI90DRAFT_2179828 [Cantharellus anzutake]